MNKSKIVFSLLLLLIVASCKKTNHEQQATPVVLTSKQTNLIASYPPGFISIDDKIEINFQKPFSKTELENFKLSFSPSISGETKIVGSRKVIFEPSVKLQRGQSYKAVVDLNQLYENIEEADQFFNFYFSVKKQHLSMYHGPLSWDNAADGTYKLLGKITTNDVANLEEIKNCLSISPQDLKVNWKANNATNTFEFEILGIKRDKESKELILKYNGNSIGAIDDKGVKKIRIPAIGEFKVLEANLDTENTQNLRITFSELLDPNQNLEGMIKIKDYTDKLNFEISANAILVYPKEKLSGTQTIMLASELRNTSGQTLSSEAKYEVTFANPDPSLELIGKGVICPNMDGLIFPFRAIKLRAVDVEIFKVFDDNVLQYFQGGYYANKSYNTQTNKVGRVVLQTAVDLGQLNESADLNQWTSYGLDLSEMIKMDPGSIYEVRISFRKEYGITDCSDSNQEPLDLEINKYDENKTYTEKYNSYYGYKGYYPGFYQDQDNPCKHAYYTRSRFIRRKIYSSNIGVIAKLGASGNLFINANDLVTTEPLSNINIDILDYQLQLIKTLTTNTDGSVVSTTLERAPHFIVAHHNQQKGIVALNEGWSLSLSNFDVSGSSTQSGLKGQFYTERGVYRPGDDIYLNFVLEDKLNTLPDNHPVQLLLTDPQGKEVSLVNTIQNVNGIYPFQLSTDLDGLTGNYQAELRLGGSKFVKSIKVETVKPNRLKIKFKDAEETILSSDKAFKTDLNINWLVGTPAKNAKAKVEMQIKEGAQSIEEFPDYHFYDLTRKYQGNAEMIFDGQANASGVAVINHPLGQNDNLPGMMKLSFQTKAFEPGGDFSIDNFSLPYSPFSHYVGIKLPQTEYGGDRLDQGQANKIEFVSVNESSKKVSGRKLKGGIYRLEWRWWWNRQGDRLSRYNTDNYTKAIQTFELNTNSQGASFDFNPVSWGRYLIRVCDEESGHCSSKICYAGYPYGNDSEEDFATMLTLSSDKEEYKVGEQIKLKFPSAEGGRALISFENGSDVLQTTWVNTTAGQTEFNVTADPSMAPTAYANISYVQSQKNVENDKPLRMYGIIPLSVYDPQTKLNPVIKSTEVFAPEENVSIQVSEQNGKEMTYTLAVVDEGLLDLTRFKTPDLWEKFYTREALGVKTWDLYDYVMGSMAGQIDRILSIGGDEELNPKDKKNKANRFEPVVQHFGPFYLKAGNKKTHDFTMPNYVGSVRVMVVAAHEGAYGKAELTTPVKKPLMLLSTLPRVLSPGESLQVPISVFALENKIKDVKITIEDEAGLVKFPKGNKTQVSFSQIGEEMAYVDIQIPETIGVAKFNIVAESAGERASQQIEIQVDNPNEMTSEVEGTVLKAGDSWSATMSTIGMLGTNKGVLEVSNVPPFDLDKRLRYLLSYPHGCLEQTTSKAFPLLYLDRFVELSEAQKEERIYYIEAAIDKIGNFALGNGAFAYWPNRYVNPYSNTYAGHFLLEAKKLGFAVPQGLLDNWISHQKNQANQFAWSSQDYRNTYFTQAYRLYTLALAGHTQLGEMNRLRQKKNLNAQTQWRLAAAYAVDSRPEVAKEIIKNIPSDEDYKAVELGYNFRSSLRDESMILETLSLIGDKDNAFKLMFSMSKSLEGRSYYNTQALSYALISIGKFLSNKQSDRFDFQFNLAGQNTTLGSDKSVMSIEVDLDKNKDEKLSVQNKSQDDLFVRFIKSGKPVQGDSTPKSDGIKMTVQYLDGAGKELDITQLTQSQDIISKITISHDKTRGNTYKNLALTQIIPSGWEIINERLTDVDNKFKSSISQYQDVRDDRVHTYFDLNSKESKTFYTRMTATYQGNYYLPNQVCKAMYDESIQATVPGKLIQIKKQNL